MTDNLFLDTIAGKKQSETPIWVMRQAGRYLKEYRAVRASEPDFISFCLNPKKAVEVTLQPIDRFQFDAAIMFSDILMVPWALDRNVRFKTGVGPLLDPLAKPGDLDSKLLDYLEDRLAPVGEAIRLCRDSLPAHKALIGFAGAPWTIITYMAEGGSSRDFPTARQWAWSDAKGFDQLLDQITHATADFLTLQAKNGADALMLFDSWASAVPASQRRRIVIEPAQKIISILRDRGITQPIIGFPKGISEGLIAYANETDIDAIGLDHNLDPAWAGAALPKSLPLQGNLDPLSLIDGGEAMFRAIDDVMNAFHDRPHIFNLGHGITPPTPVANVQAMLDYVRGWK